MSSKMGVLETPEKSNAFEWTSAGTARSYFVEMFENESSKKQVFVPSLPKSLKKLKKEFAKNHIGSELFFQAFDFLIWIDDELENDKILGQRFLVMLSGILLMRKANIFGSTCIPWKILKKQILNILINSGFLKEELTPDDWKKWLLSISKNSKFSKSKITEKTIFFEKSSHIYFYKNWILESKLVNLIRDRLKIKLYFRSKRLINSSFESVFKENPIRFGEEAINLSSEQRKAVLLAITSPFLIITGGPGTGKTSLVVIILRVLKRLGLANNPALGSPTGRAAKRMYESVKNSINSIKNLSDLKHDKELLEVGAQAKTLHRLLGYNHSKNYFKHHEFDPFEYDLLIIDEGSMIDQDMMTCLFKASNSRLPNHPPVPRLILLGDPHQLPAVRNGAVFSELTSFSKKIEIENIENNQLKIVRLSRNYRQEIGDASGRNILGVTETIKNLLESKKTKLLFENNSHLNQETIQEVNSIEKVDFEKVSFLNQTNSQEKLKEFGKWWVENFLSNEKFIFEIQKENAYEEFDYESNMEYLFKYLDRFRILTVTQVFSTGAKAINKIIREIWLAKYDTKNSFSEHYPGEPVMITKNDYLHDLFNGDIGIFLKFFNPDSRKVELKVVFQVNGGFKSFYANEFFHMQTAYAITVHKSQGSEYANLALILPELDIELGGLDPKIKKFSEIMTSEMLYTALTRAKKSVLILGRQSVLEFLALNKIVRFSGLGNNLILNEEL